MNPAQSPETEPETPTDVLAEEGATPHERLDVIRARLAQGERLRGPLENALNRAVAAVDPAATEETLALLKGSGGMELYRSLILWAGPVAGERVLDIGCGSGASTRACAAIVGSSGSVVGTDPSPEAISEARARSADFPNVVYRRASAENLVGIDDRRFDFAVASLVLDHVADLGAALREAHRVLRPGGRFVASVMAFDQLRPIDSGFMGALNAVVARHAPGALAGRASRATIPHERPDRAAFEASNLLRPEERDGMLILEMDDPEQAWNFFARTTMVLMLSDAGRDEFREVLARRLPHTLSLPIRLMRSRRPG